MLPMHLGRAHADLNCCIRIIYHLSISPSSCLKSRTQPGHVSSMDADWCGGPDSEEIISEVVASHGNRDAIRTIRAVLQGNGQGNGQLIRDTLAAHVNTSLLLGTDGDPDCCRRAYEEEGGIAVNTPIAVGPCVAATPSRHDPPTHPQRSQQSPTSLIPSSSHVAQPILSHVCQVPLRIWGVVLDRVQRPMLPVSIDRLA